MVILNPNAIAAPTPCVDFTPEIVSWWRFEGDGQDWLGRNPATLQGGPVARAGMVGQALFFDGRDDRALTPPSTSLTVTGSFTVEGWINPGIVSAPQPILEWADGTNQGVQLWLAHPSSTGSGSLFADVVDTTQRSHHLASPVNRVAPGVWSHIALTYNRTNGVGRLYVNGVQQIIAAVGIYTPQTRFGVVFGHHTAGTGSGTWFTGGLDEMSVYPVALDTAQIQAIHGAQDGGRCLPGTPPIVIVQPVDDVQPLFGTAVFTVVASGPGPLLYQWQHEGTPIAGATNATMVFSNVVLSQSGKYAASVSNPHGTVLSSNAVLTVLPGSAPLVLPNPFVTVNGESATDTFRSRARVQQVYSSSHFARGPIFSGPILIHALRWRPSAPVGHAFTGLVVRLQIHLSSTQADPEELQFNFAANTGADETLVFDGNIALSSAFAGPAVGPKEFDIVVPLTTPFEYDPGRGHLLVDLRNLAAAGASMLDAAIRTNDAASRVFASNPAAAVGTGRDIAADIISVDFTSISRPPSIYWSPQRHFVVPEITPHFG